MAAKGPYRGTYIYMRKNSASMQRSKRMLVGDALAPVIQESLIRSSGMKPDFWAVLFELIRRRSSVYVQRKNKNDCTCFT